MKINSFFGIAVCYINCFFTFAYDELDIKTAKEVLEQEIYNLTPYYDDSFLSKSTKDFIANMTHGNNEFEIDDKDIVNDFNRLYKKLDKDYGFNPSKFKSEYRGYRNTDNKNLDYVYFYLLLGAIKEYNENCQSEDKHIDIPELDTSNFICKEGEYFNNYTFQDTSTHYFNECYKQSGNKNISNRRSAGVQEQIETTKKEKQKEKENNVFNYLKSLDDNFQIFQNLKDKEPINFKKRVFQNFKSEFDQLNPSDIRPSHVSILKPSAKSLEAIEGGWGYKPLEERTGVEKNIVFGHILNKDILKKMVDKNYIDAADAADIMVKNKEIAAFLLNVLKKNKNKLLEPTFKFETGNLAVKKVSQADRERYNNEKRDRKELYKKFEKQLTDIIEN